MSDRHVTSEMGTAADIRAVLFDRDGTLIADVPYNDDPFLVRPLLGAVTVVERLREAGIAVGVVSNQSGIGRGLVSRSGVEAVNARVDELVGPFDVWRYCPHAPEERCGCRKPEPGLVISACNALGVPPEQTVVIGDIGADVEAARAAGANGLLVPGPSTRAAEITAALETSGVCDDLAHAVERVLRAGSLSCAAGVRL